MKRLSLDQLIRDLRTALHSMTKYPVACTVAVISLAAGIGCTTATLTIRNAVFYNPPPLLENPEELTVAGMSTPDRPRRRSVPRDVYLNWREESSLIAGIGARTAAITRDVRTNSATASLAVQAITPEVFSVLGVNPISGRTFSTGDIRSDGPPAVVLSFQTWERIFGADRNAVGSPIWIDDQPYTVVGVMPRRYRSHRGIWIPLNVAAARPAEELEVVIRRRPDVTETVLTQALQKRLSDYTSTLPESQRDARVQVAAMRGTPLGEQISPAVVWILGACVALTLLISCTNVAVLMIAQWTAREREIAIRASLGASRWRVIRLLLAESTLLAVFGGILGVAATFAFTGLIISRGPEDIPFYNFGIDWSILAQVAAVTFIVGILAGIAPALYETRRLHTNPLRLIPTDRVRQRWRNALVILEITVTIALLVVTSTMVDGYHRSLSWDFKFDTAPLFAVRLPAGAAIPSSEIRSRISGVPGVVNVAEATAIPVFGGGSAQKVGAARSSQELTANRSLISANFFSTLGVALRRGRNFSSDEEAVKGARVAIVNETLAARLFPGEDPVGSVIWNEDSPFDIVGVVADYIENPLGRPRPSFYLPLSARPENGPNTMFLVETAGNPLPVVQAARTELEKLDRGISVRTMRNIVETGAEEIAVTVFPMTPLIGTGILLTAAGIYGILAFAITRRSKELAVRIAVGARRRDLLGLIARLSMRLVGAGAIMGVGLTFGLSRFIQGVGGVFDSPRWPVFVVPVLIILVVGVIATWVPSRRALSLDPASLLRTE